MDALCQILIHFAKGKGFKRDFLWIRQSEARIVQDMFFSDWYKMRNGHVSFCHHFASVVSVCFTLSSSHLKLCRKVRLMVLNQICKIGANRKFNMPTIANYVYIWSKFKKSCQNPLSHVSGLNRYFEETIVRWSFT